MGYYRKIQYYIFKVKNKYKKIDNTIILNTKFFI